jgi:hypothetical protein
MVHIAKKSMLMYCFSMIPQGICEINLQFLASKTAIY